MEASPKLTAKSKILSIDVESNGLHGPAFAVGAVLVSTTGEILDDFLGRCPIRGTVDPWVKDNVLPPIKDVPILYRQAKQLRSAFWTWYKPAKAQASLVLLDNAYPVEARFLIKCQDDDLAERYWDHPFPVLDLSSLLLAVGEKPAAVRKRLVADQIGQADLQHNPRWDAWVSALAALKALKMAGQLH